MNHYGNKEFSEMENSYKNIKNNLNKVVPIESIINEARIIENLHNLIKNNDGNFELSNEAIELAKKLA